MYKARITAVLGAVAVLAVTACAGNAHPAAGSAHIARKTTPAAQVTDPNGQSCAALDGLGYCPGDDPTDPNGQSCAALDSLGYCPGDDPTPMQQWCAGDGYSDYQAVQSDMTQMQTDAGNDLLGSVMSDGTSLASDALKAEEKLPPGTNTQKLDYGLYMGFIFVAGGKASSGDINGAVTATQKASQYTSTVNNLTDQCSS